MICTLPLLLRCQTGIECIQPLSYKKQSHKFALPHCLFPICLAFLLNTCECERIQCHTATMCLDVVTSSPSSRTFQALHSKRRWEILRELLQTIVLTVCSLGCVDSRYGDTDTLSASVDHEGASDIRFGLQGLEFL